MDILVILFILLVPLWIHFALRTCMTRWTTWRSAAKYYFFLMSKVGNAFDILFTMTYSWQRLSRSCYCNDDDDDKTSWTLRFLSYNQLKHQGVNKLNERVYCVAKSIQKSNHYQSCHDFQKSLVMEFFTFFSEKSGSSNNNACKIILFR